MTTSPDFYDLTRQMLLIRRVEESLLELFSKGLLRGTVHTCIGQEACAVGVVNALDKKKDILFSNHRGHGHYLAYSNDVYGLIAEVMGRKDGVCLGIGGSQHLHKNNYYSNGIQGAGVPIVAGMALAEKLKKSGAIAVAFIGDGTFGEGIIYETFNIASLWNLPVLIVVEHNKYAQSTPSHMQHIGSFEERANAFQIETKVIDGMELETVHSSAIELVNKVRETSKPKMLILNTYRFSPHSKGDDFRAKEEIDSYKLQDPIDKMKNILNKDLFNEIESEVQKEIKLVVDKLVG